MEKHKCIYCLKEKEKNEFNVEHVISRMFGTYKNSFTLHDYEVCEECNSYFSKELESSMNLNSFEGFLRMLHGRPMSDGRYLRKERVSLSGVEGMLKGLSFTPIVDKENEEKLQFHIDPCIGIMSEENSGEYNYYSLQDLPNATANIVEFLKQKEKGIIRINIEDEIALQVLKEKGYIESNFCQQGVQIFDLYKEPGFETQVKISVDSIVRRFCAKTVLNYLCYSKGKEYVSSTNFDEIRRYIRYGVWSDNLWFRYSKGPVTTVDLPNNTAHAVGYMWYPENKKWTLCGCLTWFGEVTYVFKLGITDIDVVQVNVLPGTKIACFNNVDRTIQEDEAVHIYGGRPNTGFNNNREIEKEG